MWEGLLSSIRQMGVFMICAQALIYFKPKGSYEKYLKLLVGAMILVQLLSPVAALLAGKGGQSLEERIGFYTNAFEQGMNEAMFQEYRVEQIRQRLLTSQIRARSEEWDAQPKRQEEGQAAAGQGQRGEGEIRVEIAPVTIEALDGGQRDMGRREDGHGGEDQGQNGEMAEER